MLGLVDHVVGNRRVRIAASERSDGDLHPGRVSAPLLAARQHSLVGSRVALAEQVHGVDVEHIDASFAWPRAGRADVLVSDGTPIGVWAADCAPVFLISSSGTIVGAHGGWRGLAAGVIDVAVSQVHAVGDTVALALLGPVIHPCCYEFSSIDRAKVAAGVHSDAATLSATTTSGADALDVPAAVRAGLAEHGIELQSIGDCTGCSERWFSHRVRRDTGRHAVMAWSRP